VDDDAIVRHALGTMLPQDGDIRIVGLAATAEEALALLGKTVADVIVMDLGLPGMNGAEATAAARRVRPGVNVLVLTSLDGDVHLQAALSAGASGYLLKDTPPDALREGVRATHRGLRVVAPEPFSRLVSQRATARVTAPELTGREREVLALLCRGLSNSEIASRMHLSISGAKAGVAALMTKLGASSRLHAVAIAHQIGLVD